MFEYTHATEQAWGSGNQGIRGSGDQGIRGSPWKCNVSLSTTGVLYLELRPSKLTARSEGRKIRSGFE